MATIGAAAPPIEVAEAEAESGTTAQTGATSFSDLVRAHFRREQERKRDGVASEEAQADYEAKLAAFEREEGKIAAVYWSTREASAVAMTVGKEHGRLNPFAETDTKVRLHRVTDWVTKDRSEIADLLHECDLLAIRVGEILRGASERITMRWIFAVQAHLLGFFERVEESGGTVAAANGSLWSRAHNWQSTRQALAQSRQASRNLVEAQRRELVKVEEYYLRLASKAGRIVYVSGMMIGAVVAVAIAASTAVVLAHSYPERWTAEVQNLLLCVGAGAVGALTSVLSRMSGEGGSFTVDVEVGRPLLRRLGLYKPIVGSVFGVALYFLLASELLMTKAPEEGVMFFYGIIAFFAGFSERFTGVIFGGAQRLVTGEPEEVGADATKATAEADVAGKTAVTDGTGGGTSANGEKAAPASSVRNGRQRRLPASLVRRLR